MADHDLLLANATLGAISFGIGVVLLLAQVRTRTNVGLAGVYVVVGITLPVGQYLAGNVDDELTRALSRVQGVLEAVAVLCAALFLKGLGSTAALSAVGAARVASVVSVTRLTAGAMAVAALVLPTAHANVYIAGALDPASLRTPEFWLFAGLWLLVALAFTVGYALVGLERLDPGEHSRAVCALAASPLLVLTTALPLQATLVTGVLSMVIMLFGQFRYTVAQGEQSAFLSRFLSPQVSELVRTDGLESVTRASEIDVTVVACDLRGFTPYAEAVPPQAVMDLLSEYYEAVGSAAAEQDGTIKDYAGDGLLILVGAPLAREDHAAAGVRLAHCILDATWPVLDHWSTGPHPLGIGVGVASGRVAVGAIGSIGRMEYTAVGTPVNVAARLCGAAGDGEILLDGVTARTAGHDLAGTSAEELQLKGMSTPRRVHRLVGRREEREPDLA